MLVTEESFDSQYYVAHNKYYEQVRLLSRYINQRLKHRIHKSCLFLTVYISNIFLNSNLKESVRITVSRAFAEFNYSLPNKKYEF